MTRRSTAEAEEERVTLNNTGVPGDKVLSYIERVERLEEEIKALQQDRKEVYGEAKALGFDTKTLRTIVKIRKKSEEERAEERELLDLYMSAIGLFE